jgi:predicted nucleotidyltransferase
LNLRPKDLHILSTIFSAFPAVREVKVFGSRATNTARRSSDLDLAILAPHATPAEWSDICEAVENAPLIYELDLVRLDQTTSPRLREKIDREGRRIYPVKAAA